MENKKNILTNKKMKQKTNKNKKKEKIQKKESFIYKKIDKKKMNLSFDLDQNNNIDNDELNRMENNNEKIFLLNDVELFDEPKKSYNKNFFKTQSNFLNKNNDNKSINKIFNHNENVFDNEQYRIIGNGDNKMKEQNNPNNISFIQKGNKIEYSNINQNNSFCVSINNNYNYNFSLNNYNNEEDFENHQNEGNNWKKKLNIINEQKKRMKQFNLGNNNINVHSSINKKEFVTNINNENEENDGEEEEKRKKFKIKKFYSTHFLNKNNSSVGQFNNKERNNLNINDSINYISNNIYNNYNFNQNKFRGRIKELNDYENNYEDNITEDKFTFKINKNNIDEKNSEVCELDIPASNMNLYGNLDEKTAQFPDVINKEDCYKFIPKNITNYNDFNNNNSNYINNNTTNENKIYTKGRYDFLSSQENKKNKIINNNIYNTEKNIKNNYDLFSEGDNENFISNDLHKNMDDKIFTYSHKNKSKMIDGMIDIKPRNLFKYNNDNIYENDSIISNNIQEIRLNMKTKKHKKIIRDRNCSLNKSYTNLNGEIDKDNNHNNYFNNIGKSQNENFLYLKPNKIQTNINNPLVTQKKYFYQTLNDEAFKNNQKKDNIDINNSNSFYEFENEKLLNNNSVIIYKKKTDIKKGLNDKGFMIKHKKIDKYNSFRTNKAKLDNKIKNINTNNDTIKQKYGKKKLFYKTMTSSHFLLNNNLNKKKLLNKNNNNITHKKANNNYSDNSSIILNKCKINTVNKCIKKKMSNPKLCLIQKYNNYSMKLPKIISINSFITKEKIINNILKVIKNEKILVCYFSKKYMLQQIIKIPKLNVCYLSKSIYANFIKNSQIRKIEENSNNENLSKRIIKFEEKNTENSSLLYKANIMARKLTDIFNEKKNIVQKELKDITNIDENLYINKCKTYKNKNTKLLKYFELLSDENINKINKLENIIKNKVDEHNIFNNSNDVDNNKEKNDIDNKQEVDNSLSGKKKRRRLGTKIEEENDDENENINKNNLDENISDNKLLFQIKEDINNYFNMNENNKYDNNISKNELLNCISVPEIIKVFIKACFEDSNLKEKNIAYKNYFKEIIEIYLNKYCDSGKCKDEIEKIIFDIIFYNNLNTILYEILGYIIFILIENKLYSIENFKELNSNENNIENKICILIKYTIISDGNKMKKYYEDFKSLFKDNKKINDYISNIIANS